MVSSSKVLLLLCAGVLLGACDEQPTSDATALDDNAVAVIPSAVTPDLHFASTSTSFGDPFQRLTAEERQDFADGLEEFSAAEEVDEGLGPVFNEDACIVCHNDPVGGTTGRLETRFGRRGFNSSKFDALEALGGSLLQDQGIGKVPGFFFAAEKVPRAANVVASRLTTPLFGLGLVDAVPDAELIELAQLQRNRARSTAGIANMVTDIATGQQRVGRFGWKAQVATLQTFAGDAYLNEMGITSPNFPNENCPQGNCDLLRFNPLPTVNDSGDGVTAFKNFMTLLAPPPRGQGASREGEDIFQAIGCANCHTPKLATGSSPIAALDHKVFEPFSDFLLHDMGRLADGITQGNATGRLMRTAALWGLRVRPVYLHDGRATTVTAAILAHDGQGQRARERFTDLSSSKRRTLLAYLNSL